VTSQKCLCFLIWWSAVKVWSWKCWSFHRRFGLTSFLRTSSVSSSSSWGQGESMLVFSRGLDNRNLLNNTRHFLRSYYTLSSPMWHLLICYCTSLPPLVCLTCWYCPERNIFFLIFHIYVHRFFHSFLVKFEISISFSNFSGNKGR